jgi:hypothetical protein
MVSPVHGDHRRCQAEIPLIVLCRFPEPVLSSLRLCVDASFARALGELSRREDSEQYRCGGRYDLDGFIARRLVSGLAELLRPRDREPCNGAAKCDRFNRANQI